MLELKNGSLEFSFPEVHPEAKFRTDLVRTLRIPDDDKEYPLPPGLGHFPLRHTEDFKGKVPAKWAKRGGLLLPMYQSEAMWLNFTKWSVQWCGPYPVAVKVAAGKVSAITGKKWKKGLRRKDYMLGHKQPWLDGYVVEGGTVRQFVAEPLGMGMTAEGQITGKEEFGGVQIEVFPLKRAVFDAKFPARQPSGGPIRRGLRSRVAPQSLGSSSRPKTGGHWGDTLYSPQLNTSSLVFPGSHGVPGVYCATSTKSSVKSLTPQSVLRDAGESTDSLELLESSVQDMGLAAGGRMRQQVFEDTEFDMSDWDVEHGSRVFIHLVNSMVWRQVTGEAPPLPPLTAAEYSSHGYPWFDYWDDEIKAAKGTKKTAGLKSVAELEKQKGVKVLPENQSLPAVSKLIPQKGQVADGDW